MMETRIIKVVTSGEPLRPGHARVAELTHKVDLMDSTVPIKQLHFWESAPGAFTYRIDLTDGRIWSQVITFDIVADPKMTFAVTTAWRQSEFDLHREIRALVIALKRDFAVTEFQYSR